MSTIDTIRFSDLNARQSKAHADLNYEFRRLEDIEAKNNRTLSDEEERRKKQVKEILDVIEKSQNNTGKVDENADPLFVATRTLLNEDAGIDPELRGLAHSHMLFGDVLSKKDMHDRINAGRLQSGDVTLAALTLGILSVDNATAPPVHSVGQDGTSTGKLFTNPTNDPKLKHNGKTLYPDKTDWLWGSFTKSFFNALGEARSYGSLAARVLNLLAIEADPDGPGVREPKVSAQNFARVMRGLAADSVTASEPMLRRKVNEQLDLLDRVGSDEIGDLKLDDFNSVTDNNIVAENVLVMGPMIVSAMFEELKVFQVVDKIVEQFQHGMLPVGPGNAGKMLYKYWREAPNRMSELERRNFASMTLGVPGGEPGAMVNRDFNDLWIRFVSSVSNFVRQNEVDQLLRSRTPAPINQQQVRKSARDLAGNLTLHGYGMAHFAGRELTQQINTTIKLLGDPEIKGAYGAKDMWQVVDQVATYDLGGAKTSSRYRTLASCGLIITAWISRNIERIVSPTAPIIDMSQVRFPNFGDGHNATTNPNDYDLVNACELWLADTATTDSQVEEMSQPREAPQMTSKPIPIPAMAKEMLDGIGDIGLGLGMNGRAQQFH
jgi:hypothetical protein